MMLKRIGFIIPSQDMYVENDVTSYTWEMSERIGVLNYLGSGNVLNRFGGTTACTFGCKSSVGLGNSEMTDAVWIWPEYYQHYIQCHSIKPDMEFIQHIRNNLFRVPI